MEKYFYFNWDFLPAKVKKLLRNNDILNDLILFLSSMFEYKGMDESINTNFIEYYLMMSPLACAGIFKNKLGREIVGYASEGGALDDYLIPSKYNINTLGASHATGVIPGINCAIGYNNKTHTNDISKLMRFTELLALTETAQKCLLRYARLFPVFEVNDSIIEEQLRTALKNADNGEPFTFATKGLSKLGIDGQPGVNVIQLGDFSAIEKIQYLSTYRNDLLRLFFSFFGMSYSQSTKQAQQSIEEVHSENKISWILPEDRLAERNKLIEQYNKTFNHQASVDYSKAWLDAYEEFKKEGQTDGEKMEYNKSIDERPE